MFSDEELKFIHDAMDSITLQGKKNDLLQAINILGGIQKKIIDYFEKKEKKPKEK